LENPDYVKKLKANTNMGVLKKTMEGIATYLQKANNMNIEQCVAWARVQFEELFHNNIAQLIYNFPEDHTASNGVSIPLLFCTFSELGLIFFSSGPFLVRSQAFPQTA